MLYLTNLFINWQVWSIKKKVCIPCQERIILIIHGYAFNHQTSVPIAIKNGHVLLKNTGFNIA